MSTPTAPPTPAFCDPAELHDPVPFGYRHTVHVPAGAGLVLVSGQDASGPDGAVVSADFGQQVERTFAVPGGRG